nr:MAG TPA: hypothetical protein [Caudoviricetes sp.]
MLLRGWILIAKSVFRICCSYYNSDKQNCQYPNSDF